MNPSARTTLDTRFTACHKLILANRTYYRRHEQTTLLYHFYLLRDLKPNFNETSTMLLGIIKIFNQIKLRRNILIEIVTPSPKKKKRKMEEKVQENRFLMVKYW